MPSFLRGNKLSLYDHWMCYNKVYYSTTIETYFMTNIKLPVCMPYFSLSKIILHQFYVGNNEGDSIIGYDVIICCDLMLQLDLSDDFKHQVLQCDADETPTKQHSGLLGQIYLTSRKMRKVVIQTKIYSTRKAKQ